MANNVSTASESDLLTLVNGIIQDTQRLFAQQMALFRSEVRADMARTRDAAMTLGLGAGVCLLSGVMLCLMIVYLLNWANPELPLWACYGLVGFGLACLGGALVYLGKKKFESFNPLPDETAKALEENVQWLTTSNPK